MYLVSTLPKVTLKRLYSWLPLSTKSLIARKRGLYPRVVQKELKEVKKILGSTSWNMSYSINGKHSELEKFFANYIGSEFAVAVGSGGVGLQMLTRSLGLGVNSEVVMQVDTCAAVPQAILNAQAIPVFVDTNTTTFQFSLEGVKNSITKNTRLILATHMWGNPEDLDSIKKLADDKDVFVVEDACLALGSRFEHQYLGSLSKAGVFSFGSTKPLQAGEGGMLVTNDKELARELRSMRSWGDRETEYGIRDVRTLSWNGRMPEVIAAIALEQLRGYPERLERIQARVSKFRDLVRDVPDFKIVPTLNQEDLAYTQVALKLTSLSRYTKQEIFKLTSESKIPVFHANFEPITELSLFRSGDWLNWIKNKHYEKNPTSSDFPGAYEVYQKFGIGLTRTNFESDRNFKLLCKFINNYFKS